MVPYPKDVPRAVGAAAAVRLRQLLRRVGEQQPPPRRSGQHHDRQDVVGAGADGEDLRRLADYPRPVGVPAAEPAVVRRRARRHVHGVERLYYIEAGDIARLRDAASAGAEQQRASRVQAVSAYLWKALAGVVAASCVPEERCCMGWWVDARRRVASPALVPAMCGYCGNVTSYALGDAAVGEVLERPLAEVAAMVRESSAASDYDEYLQELVDWVVGHKTEKVMEKGGLGLGSPTVTVGR